MRGLTSLLLKTFSRAARPYLNAQGLLKTAKVFNRSALVWNPGAEKVVVLAPHMDDETIGCGGTLARHVLSGASITVVFLTDGAGGGAVDSDGRRDSLTAVRKREARTALSVLGIERLEFLDAPDGHLASADGAVTSRLRKILIDGRFDLVYLPFFLEEHPDHRAASRVLIAALRDSGLDLQCMGYEVWTPLFPNCLVNIDATVERKREALGHYRTQLAEADYPHTQLGLNAYRSAAFLGGTCRYAEAFCALPLDQYRDLYSAYAGAG
jgi:LmbE family N-acetylglucosaminyl deacetylase